MLAAAAVPPPLDGPFATAHKVYLVVPGLDSTSSAVDVFYATNSTAQPSFISFAHGFNGGGWKLPIAYTKLLTSLASWGYVIAAPRACDKGCHDSPEGLPQDPPGFRHFYVQQLKVIDWAKAAAVAGDPVLSLANFTRGVGISGHSMDQSGCREVQSHLSAIMVLRSPD